ncbi:Biotin transporter BioY [compost metagenome]
MILEQSFVPGIILKNGNKISHNLAATLIGSSAIALLAQISIPLSFTPVPITGQTFGVALISLLWGKWRGVAAVTTYLILGFSGVPIFALGKSGWSFGPTSGYLVGMIAAAFLMGTLSDRGWTKKLWRTWLAAFLGSCVTFSFGVLVLSLYVPKESLLIAGVIPFVPGDLVKTLMACFIVRQVSQSSEQQQ